ncbi:hypothetical protein F5877DRAFT_69424 [Lentinula edodes]|nr:hypothetical protein F5877DRAFT_69424 [Lentinula edodes]
MTLQPEMDKQDLSALTNQKQRALSTEGFDGPVNGALQTEWTVGEDRGSEDRQGLAGSEDTKVRRATPKTKTMGEGLVKDVAKKDKEKGWGAGSAKGEGKNSAEVGSGRGDGPIGREAKTADAWIDCLSGSQNACLNNVSSNDHDESGDKPLATSLLLSPMSEGPEVIVDSLKNATMEAHVEKDYGIDLDMSSVSKVVQVVSKLKKTAIAVGGWQMEMWNVFRDKTSTLCQDLSKLEERVARAEKGQAGSEKAGEFILQPCKTWVRIDFRIVAEVSSERESSRWSVSPGSGGRGGCPQALEGVTEKRYIVQRYLDQDNRRDEDRSREAEIRKQRVREIHIVSRYKGTGTGPMQKGVQEVNKGTSRNLGNMRQVIKRVAQEKRQEEEAQVERMLERAREVMGYGAQRKRLGEDKMVYEGHSGKLPHGNSAENYQHDQGYRAPLPHLAQPPAFAPTAPARNKQELKLAIGEFRGQYATAGVGDQIVLIAKSVLRSVIPRDVRSVIPRDVRRDDYQFGVLVMTFQSYHDRDAFTREWSAGYKNSPIYGKRVVRESDLAIIVYLHKEPTKSYPTISAAVTLEN